MMKKIKIVGMRRSKVHRTGLDTYLMLGIFVLMIFLIYLGAEKVEKEPPQLIEPTDRFSQVFADGMLTLEEEKLISQMDCEELKEFVGTNKSVCLYFKEEGHLRAIDGKMLSVGCPGLEVGGYTCGEILS